MKTRFLLALMAYIGFSFGTGISNCTVISSPGEYELVSDLSGAPYQYGFLSSYGTTWTYKACIVVESDDVAVDCAGHRISGSSYNMSPPGYVITSAVYTNYDNITLKNCPEISGYSNGMDGRNATVAISNSSFSGIPQTAINLYFDSNQGTQTAYDNASLSGLEFKDLSQATNIMGYYDVSLNDSRASNISSSLFNFYQITGKLDVDSVDAAGFFFGGTLAADRLSLKNSRFAGATYGVFGSGYVRYEGLVENNTFISNESALWLSTPYYGGPSAASVVIRGNRFSGNRQYAQYVYASGLDSLLLEGNDFYGGGRGAYLYRIKNLTARNNSFEDLASEGIQGTYVDGASVTDSKFTDVASDSVSFINSKGIAVRNLTLEGQSHGMGVRMDYSQDILISGIQMNASGRTNGPIWVQGSNDTEISDVRISDSPYSLVVNGMGARNIYIHDVEISNASSPGTSALYLPAVSGAVVRDVSIERPYYGIYISEARDVLMDNLSVRDPVYVGAYISGSRQNITFDGGAFSGAGLDQTNVQLEGAGISSYNASFSAAGTRFYGNRHDILLRGSFGPDTNFVSIDKAVFDGPGGGMEGYSTVSLNATVDGRQPGSPPNLAGEAIIVNWTSSSPPEGLASFHGMWVSVQNLPAYYYYAFRNASVDSLSMSWSPEQEAGYQSLQMWQYSGNWTMLDSTSESRSLSAPNVTAGTVGVLYPAFPDSDGDGVGDAEDKCPGTAMPEKAVPSESLLPKAFAIIGTDGYFSTNAGTANQPRLARSGYGINATYGCSCEQILFCKPGNSEGEYRFGCSQGTMNVWTRQEAWATDCQAGGRVASSGEVKSLLADTDGSILPDIFDRDDDNDGVWDYEDIEVDAKPGVNGSTTGIPDWWCSGHPGRC